MYLKDYVTFAHDRPAAPLRERSAPPPRPDAALLGLGNVDIDFPRIDRPRAPDWLEDSVEFDGRFLPRHGEAAPELHGSESVVGVAPDALAFYRPFHFYVAGAWGIYVHEPGIVRLAVALAHGTWDEKAADVAFDALVEHEVQHCVAETGMTRIEIMNARPVYPAWFAHPQGSFLEEAMANARSSSTIRKKAARYSPALDAWMKGCGPGYRDFARFLSPEDFLAGQQRCGMLALVLAGTGPADGPVHFLLDASTTPKRQEVPVYLVLDERPNALRLPDHVRQEFRARADGVLIRG